MKVIEKTPFIIAGSGLPDYEIGSDIKVWQMHLYSGAMLLEDDESYRVYASADIEEIVPTGGKTPLPVPISKSVAVRYSKDKYINALWHYRAISHILCKIPFLNIDADCEDISLSADFSVSDTKKVLIYTDYMEFYKLGYGTKIGILVGREMEENDVTIFRLNNRIKVTCYGNRARQNVECQISRLRYFCDMHPYFEKTVRDEYIEKSGLIPGADAPRFLRDDDAYRLREDDIYGATIPALFDAIDDMASRPRAVGYYKGNGKRYVKLDNEKNWTEICLRTASAYDLTEGNEFFMEIRGWMPVHPETDKCDWLLTKINYDDTHHCTTVTRFSDIDFRQFLRLIDFYF